MLRIIAALVLSAALWVLFVAGTKPEEMIVGAICIGFTMAFTDYISRKAPILVRFRVQDLFQLWHIGWYVLTGTWEILVALALDIFGIKRADSLFRAAPFENLHDRALETAHHVLAVAYTTATPNFIILGIDSKTHQMLFHQVRRGGVRPMTRNLGAQA